MPEKQIKKKLRAFLEEIGAWQYWPVPMGYGAATVDCLFCYRGKFFAVETKRPGVKSATPRQQLTMGEIMAAGGQACVENDPALPAVRAMLAHLAHPMWTEPVNYKSLV